MKSQLFSTLALAAALAAPWYSADAGNKQEVKNKEVIKMNFDVNGDAISITAEDMKEGETRVFNQGNHKVEVTKKNGQMLVSVDGKAMPVPPMPPHTPDGGELEGTKVIIIKKEVETKDDGTGPATTTEKEVKKVMVFQSEDGAMEIISDPEKVKEMMEWTTKEQD